MILNLEAKKAVDCSERFGVVSGYLQLCTVHSILGLVDDLAFQSLHGLHPWRDSGVDKHRYIKIAFGEFNGNHCQMLSNSRLASRVGGFVALYLNGPAISEQMEMMSRLFVTEAHSLIAPRIDARKMV